LNYDLEMYCRDSKLRSPKFEVGTLVLHRDFRHVVDGGTDSSDEVRQDDNDNIVGPCWSHDGDEMVTSLMFPIPMCCSAPS